MKITWNPTLPKMKKVKDLSMGVVFKFARSEMGKQPYMRMFSEVVNLESANDIASDQVREEEVIILNAELVIHGQKE